MTSLPLLQNSFILRGPRDALFAETMKIVTICFKNIIKDSKRVKRIGNYGSKCHLYLHFEIQQNLLKSGKR